MNAESMLYADSVPRGKGSLSPYLNVFICVLASIRFDIKPASVFTGILDNEHHLVMNANFIGAQILLTNYVFRQAVSYVLSAAVHQVRYLLHILPEKCRYLLDERENMGLSDSQ